MFDRRKKSSDGDKLSGEPQTANPYNDDAAPRYGAIESPSLEARDSSLMDPDSGVKRGLKNRHLSMMALAGIIGPGLLVGAGGALNSGGPASLLIGFGVIGIGLSSPCLSIC